MAVHSLGHEVHFDHKGGTYDKFWKKPDQAHKFIGTHTKFKVVRGVRKQLNGKGWIRTYRLVRKEEVVAAR